ncbi:MAG TPA: NAD(P)-binding domain-containing protein, partial [Pinirhizobacter sp.]|uniref:NAD(P)-binding domain-containing protein n=1 Tax=Pinirhizobacter sp. TaxID=2950432 RepID=UPI002B814C29
MELGLIGLGRMGGNIVRRLLRDGHQCVVYDVSAEAREAVAKDGAVAVNSVEALVQALKGPRAVWVML